MAQRGPCSMCSYHLPAPLQLRKCTTHKEAGEIEDKFSMEFTVERRRCRRRVQVHERRPEKNSNITVFLIRFFSSEIRGGWNFITENIWTCEEA